MASYFESINNNNSTLIDDQYSNYALWKKGTVVTQGWAGIAVGARITIPSNSTGATPIIALVHNGYVNMLSNTPLTTGEWQTNFMLSEQDTSSGVTLEWYAFLPSDTPEINLKQTGMFCLWNEDGRPIFDSDANYMKVVDFVSAQYPNTTTKTYPSDRKYAVVVAVNQLYVRGSNGSPGGWSSISGMSARVRGDGNASYAYVVLRSTILGPPSQEASRTDTGVFMILDVTNM